MASPLTGLLHGLAPIWRADAKVLILGSMPGATSLRVQQYYAHPRNRFWSLMAGLYGLDSQASYVARVAALQYAGVALWDVLANCVRPGSLDSAIQRGSEVPNPIADHLRKRSQLTLIALNGGGASRNFDRFVRPELTFADAQHLQILPLPSTSPANAARSLRSLIELWAPIRI